MNENLNLVEILKDCPSGTKLYSTIFGEVELDHIEGHANYPIFIRLKFGNGRESLTKEGKLFLEFNGECTLFPSREQRDWSKFTAPWYKKERDTIVNLEKQGEKILSQTNERAWLYLVSDVLTWKDGIGQYLDDPRVQELAKRLCSEYAQKLYNPSILSNSSNTGTNKQKFDPQSLQAFDRVLVRDDCESEWQCDLFSHINYELEVFPYKCTGCSYRYCIPYNEETKHLVGSNKQAPEFYRYWED